MKDDENESVLVYDRNYVQDKGIGKMFSAKTCPE